MTKISDLPRDLVEEILSRVPMKSMRAVRFTCKNWNTLSKHLGKAAVAREGEFLAIVCIDYKAYLMSVNFHGIHNNNSDPFINLRGKLISLNESDNVDISRICHCEGLLLCTTIGDTRLVVWNPCTGQTRWIWVKRRSVHHVLCWYGHALGYEKSKSCRNHKILRFINTCPEGSGSVHEIYEFNTNSWRVLDVTRDEYIESNYVNGVSLKGNTYWRARNRNKESREDPDFLLCFDFTKERFGPHLPLPFESYQDFVTLSPFGEEQLAVLFQSLDSYEMEIWVTTKIEPNAVSWSKFLAGVDMKVLFRGSFLIDKEKRVVVSAIYSMSPIRINAYIIGENGYYYEVDVSKITGREDFSLECSYVPNLVCF